MAEVCALRVLLLLNVIFCFRNSNINDISSKIMELEGDANDKMKRSRFQDIKTLVDARIGLNYLLQVVSFPFVYMPSVFYCGYFVAPLTINIWKYVYQLCKGKMFLKFANFDKDTCIFFLRLKILIQQIL